MIPFWKYIKEHKNVLFLALVLATVNQVFSLLDPQIFRIIIDNYASKVGELERDKFIGGVILWLLAFVGVAFVSRVAKTFQDYYTNVITQKVGTTMYSRSVNHTFSLPFSVFEDTRSGEVLNKLQKARTDSQRLIENMIGLVFLSFIGMIFVIIYAFTVNWIVGLTYLSLIPIVGISTFFLSKKIKEKKFSPMMADPA
ncbi:MAG: ABC transporter transmembrane domain-containing protein [Nanoarchaeota archaeon]